MSTEQTQSSLMTLEEQKQAKRTENTMKLFQQSNDTAYNNLAKLISVDEYQSNGYTFKAKILTHIEVGQLRKLDRESRTIDQDSDWIGYTNNVREQAKILIQDFTDEIFNKADFTLLENLVVAWGMKPGGFRQF
jgi:hypothetical protein